ELDSLAVRVLWCGQLLTPAMRINEHRALPFILCCVGLLLPTRSVMAGIDWPQLSFTQIATGSSTPTSLADDGSGRLFVTEQSGRVMLVQSNGVVPFLDLRDHVFYYAGSEFGLLSVAFSPGF